MYQDGQICTNHVNMFSMGEMLVLAFALIQVPHSLWDGNASVRIAYLGEVQLEIEKIDKAVKADDDEAARELA